MEQITLDALHAKMGEFIKMEEKLPFPEFLAYYNDLMAFLQSSYQDLGQDELVTLKGITGIVSMNAKARALDKDENRKKFAKMGEKTGFWEDAISLRLKKEGMDKDALDEKVSALWD